MDNWSDSVLRSIGGNVLDSWASNNAIWLKR